MCDDICDHCYGVFFMTGIKCVTNQVVASLEDKDIGYLGGRVKSCNQGGFLLFGIGINFHFCLPSIRCEHMMACFFSSHKIKSPQI